jgi:hypothetical protein
LVSRAFTLAVLSATLALRDCRHCRLQAPCHWQGGRGRVQADRNSRDLIRRPRGLTEDGRAAARGLTNGVTRRVPLFVTTR